MPKNPLKFTWISPPSKMARKMEEYEEKLLMAIHAIAARVGLMMQNYGRLNKPWEDRSGAATSGLFFAVDGFGLKPIMGHVKPNAEALNTDSVTVSGGPDRLVLTFGHTVYYGKFLELAHGGQYAIVMSTVEAHIPILERQLNGLLDRLR